MDAGSASMEDRRRHFLLGEWRWFGSGNLPARLPHEVDAPPSWHGWRRQRLEPGLAGFLFPCAWSLFLLVAGLLPMLLASQGVDIGVTHRLGLGLWAGAFLLLWVAALGRAMRQVEGSVGSMLAWNLLRPESLLLVVLLVLLDRQPIGGIATLGLLLVLPLWLSHVVRISTLLAWPAGRWLLPVAHVDVGLAALPEGWLAESRRWARRPLASRPIASGMMGPTRMRLVLFGLRHENQDYIAIHLVHPSGALLDPFVGPTVGETVPFANLGPRFADVPSPVAIRERIGDPPVNPEGGRWAKAMIPSWERGEEE